MTIKIDLKLSKVIEKSVNIILKASDPIIIVGQLDCDGICSSGMIKIALDRENIKNKYLLVEKLDNKTLNDIKEYKEGTAVFCDFGLTKKEMISKKFHHSIIVDHHLHYNQKNCSNIIEINPNQYGFSGSKDACTSTMSFLLVLAINKNNIDLAKFYIAGAVGDRHHYNGFRGLNKLLVDNLVLNKIISRFQIPSLVGENVTHGLKNMVDPFVVNFNRFEFDLHNRLNLLGINPKTKIHNLLDEEKLSIRELILEELSNQFNEVRRNQEIIIENFYDNHSTFDINELHWLIDCAGRYKDIKTCIGLLISDSKAIEKARIYSNALRSKLVDLLMTIENEIIVHNYFQYFFTDNDMIKGLACGFSMDWYLRNDKPIFAFYKENDLIHLSARGNQTLVKNGLNLSKCVDEVCEKFGGSGGGHAIAAGGRFRSKYFKEFLLNIDNIMTSQLNNILD